MYENIALYGKDNTEGITGVQLLYDDRIGGQTLVRLYYRDKTFTDERFYPFIYLHDMSLLRTFPEDQFKWTTLEGDNYYKYIVVFQSWGIMWEAVKTIAREASMAGLLDEDQKYPKELYFFRTPEQQYLAQTGKTLFKGMEFDDVHRLYLDIETYSSTQNFSNPERTGDKIIIIVMADNRGWKGTLYLDEDQVPYDVPHGIPCRDETDLLVKLVQIIKQKDPDALIGHNVFAFDFNYIWIRAQMLGVTLDIGRDGTVPRRWESRKKFAERDIYFPKLQIAGRAVIDTYFETMSYDVYTRDLPGYGLKVIAKYFGFAPEDRTYVPGDEISEYWDTNPIELLKYAQEDVYETSRIDKHLGGSSFFLTQMIPMDYQNAALAGTATKIEALMVREYLRQRYSIPTYESGGQEVGGYTDIRKTGIYHNVIYADVASLYPSIMLAYNAHPDGDDLYVFNGLLRLLTSLRLETKAAMKKAEGEEEQSLDARQNSYKTLINSFYGAMGFKFFIFNDFSEADRVTVIGQGLVQRIANLIIRDGGDIIEIDTDGVLAIPPPHVKWGEDDEQYVKSLTERMPEGIVIDFDGRGEVMFSYKKKNYAIREPGKKKTKIKGGSLISRMYEPFAKEFLAEVVECFLNEDVQGIHDAYIKIYQKIVGRNWHVREFSKTATLKDSIETYKRKVKLGSGNGGRNKSSAYELAMGRAEDTGIRPEPGDRISYYVAGRKKPYKVRGFDDAKLTNEYDEDENTLYYLDRLRKLTKKFEKFFSDTDFEKVFPYPLHSLVMKNGEPLKRGDDSPYNVLLHYEPTNVSELEILNRDVQRVPLRVIIAGSRSITDMFWVERAIAGCKWLKQVDDDNSGFKIGTVISGHSSQEDPNKRAKGVDRLGEEWAKRNDIPLELFPVSSEEWERFGKRAGMMRNQKMIDEGKADACIVVWDGKSRGSIDMYNRALQAGLKVHLSTIV